MKTRGMPSRIVLTFLLALATLAVAHAQDESAVNNSEGKNRPGASTPHARVRVALPGLDRNPDAGSASAPTASGVGKTSPTDPASAAITGPLTPLSPLPAPESQEAQAQAEPAQSSQQNQSTQPIEAGRQLAVFAGNPITELDVMRELWRLRGKDVLDWMVGRAILKRELAARNLEVTDSEVDGRLEEHLRDLAKVFPTGRQPDDLTRSASGMGLSEYRERTVWTEIALRKLMERDLPPTDEALRAYFADKQALYIEPERVRISQVFIAPSHDEGEFPDKNDWDRAEEEIVAAHTRLRLGEEMASVNADLGLTGSGGWFARGELLRELEDVAFALSPGAMSAPIRTRLGYHIIRSEEKRQRRSPDFEAVKEKLAAEYREKFFLAMAGEYMRRLKEGAIRDGTLTLLNSDGAADGGNKHAAE